VNRFQQEADRLSLNSSLGAAEKLKLLKDKYSIGRSEEFFAKDFFVTFEYLKNMMIFYSFIQYFLCLSFYTFMSVGQLWL
jgi:hypothetical protein